MSVSSPLTYRSCPTLAPPVRGWDLFPPATQVAPAAEASAATGKPVAVRAAPAALRTAAMDCGTHVVRHASNVVPRAASFAAWHPACVSSAKDPPTCQTHRMTRLTPQGARPRSGLETLPRYPRHRAASACRQARRMPAPASPRPMTFTFACPHSPADNARCCT